MICDDPTRCGIIFRTRERLLFVSDLRLSGYPQRLKKSKKMGNINFFQKLWSLSGKIFRRALAVLAIGLVVFFCIVYWGTFETGVMAGKVLRISEKGLFFKTYEGKLSLDTFGALKGVSPIAETFDFSVQKSDTLVINTLVQVALSGERVNLHFKKRYMGFFWRGDTKYFITKVERSQIISPDSR
jgi:hypothetical protein